MFEYKTDSSILLCSPLIHFSVNQAISDVLSRHIVITFLSASRDEFYDFIRLYKFYQTVYFSQFLDKKVIRYSQSRTVLFLPSTYGCAVSGEYRRQPTKMM